MNDLSADNVPSQRVYVHEECGQQTVVDGTDLLRIANPFFPAMSTICSTCGPVDLQAVRWLDTDETIVAYRQRMRAQSPQWITWLPQILGVVGLTIGLVCGVALLDHDPKFLENLGA